MTKNEVEAIVTGLFPQKISLLDPEEAKTTIPELLAFWQFLKRAYKHKNATKIIKFLEQIQPSFKDIMNERLSEPIQLDLKRPQQKSYPPINGLYLLLRASGLGQIISKELP